MSTKPPNLRDAAQRTHKKDCRWAKFRVNRPGDVRQCEHGKIQVVNQPYINDYGYLVWMDLHPLWNRRPYKLAKQLLNPPARPTPPSHGQQSLPTASPAAIKRLETNYGDNE